MARIRHCPLLARASSDTQGQGRPVRQCSRRPLHCDTSNIRCYKDARPLIHPTKRRPKDLDLCGAPDDGAFSSMWRVFYSTSELAHRVGVTITKSVGGLACARVSGIPNADARPTILDCQFEEGKRYTCVNARMTTVSGTRHTILLLWAAAYVRNQLRQRLRTRATIRGAIESDERRMCRLSLRQSSGALKRPTSCTEHNRLTRAKDESDLTKIQ